jgi:hypothetical protein
VGNDLLLHSEGVFLLFCMKEDEEWHLYTSSPLLPQYVERPLGQVGVFLDYEVGRVSSVNETSSSLTCSLSSLVFSSPLRPFLSFQPSSGTEQSPDHMCQQCWPPTPWWNLTSPFCFQNIACVIYQSLFLSLYICFNFMKWKHSVCCSHFMPCLLFLIEF